MRRKREQGGGQVGTHGVRQAGRRGWREGAAGEEERVAVAPVPGEVGHSEDTVLERASGSADSKAELIVAWRHGDKDIL